MCYVFFFLIIGCQSDIEEVNDTAELIETTDELTDRQLLIRASLDIRGRLPSQSELDAIEHEPTEIYEIIDGFVEDDSFGLRIRDLFAGAYRTRSANYNFSDVEDDDFDVAAGEEMLKIIEYIALEDRSFREVVTADYTFANANMIEMWPIGDYDEEIGGWQRVTYDDGRPQSGILSTNSFHSRYLSNDENYNRKRANEISRILLCSNFLDIPIDFPRNIDLTDEDSINNAIRENSACVGCHITLDPMASFFFGFPGEDDDGFYNEDVALDWLDTTGQAPSFYGIDGDSVIDLGSAIADDPRFSQCATRRVFEGLVGRKANQADAIALKNHEEAFIDSDMNLRTLIRSIVRDPVYRGQSGEDRIPVGLKIMSPEVLELAVLDMTGYQMLSNGLSIMRSDNELHILGGGLSHESGDYAPTTSNVTRVLVQSQLAEGAAMYLVEQETGFYDQFFDGVDMDSAQANRSAIAGLYNTIIGLETSEEDPEIEELAQLWDSLLEEDFDAQQAWAGVISVLLRDPRFLHY